VRIFSLDYSLAPEFLYPTQFQQVVIAYEYLLNTTLADKIIIAGDSAGGSLITSLLLHIVRPCADLRPQSRLLSTPGAMIQISPWVNLNSDYASTKTPPLIVDEDFLDADMLNEYGRIYTGASPPHPTNSLTLPLRFYLTAFRRLVNEFINPPYSFKWLTGVYFTLRQSNRNPEGSSNHANLCESPFRNPISALDYPEWLADALPRKAMIVYGSKEIMAEDIDCFSKGLRNISRGTVEIYSRWKLGWHVWPMMIMYLGKDKEEIESGTRLIGDFIARYINEKPHV
jgi:acetyl esterase/lipase